MITRQKPLNPTIVKAQELLRASGERPVSDWVPRILAKLLDRQSNACADIAERIRNV